MRRASATIARAGAFLALFTALQGLWQLSSATTDGRLLIGQAVVAPAVHLIGLMSPGLHAHAEGRIIWAGGAGLDVINGCDGMAALWLLVAACAIAPLARRQRLTAALLGIPIVYAANQARLIAMVYALRADRMGFELLHGLVGPIFMVLTIAGYFFIWIDHAEGDGRVRADEPISA